jgi:hypothetical protein
VDHDATTACRDVQRAARGPIDWTFDRGAQGDDAPGRER